MASPTDRMAAGSGFGALAKADELKKRLWFTVGALIIYRLGTYLPLPGINPGALADIFSQQSSGILAMTSRTPRSPECWTSSSAP